MELVYSRRDCNGRNLSWHVVVGSKSCRQDTYESPDRENNEEPENTPQNSIAICLCIVCSLRCDKPNDVEDNIDNCKSDQNLYKSIADLSEFRVERIDVDNLVCKSKRWKR